VPRNERIRSRDRSNDPELALGREIQASITLKKVFGRAGRIEHRAGACPDGSPRSVHTSAGRNALLWGGNLSKPRFTIRRVLGSAPGIDLVPIGPAVRARWPTVNGITKMHPSGAFNAMLDRFRNVQCLSRAIQRSILPRVLLFRGNGCKLLRVESCVLNLRRNQRPYRRRRVR